MTDTTDPARKVFETWLFDEMRRKPEPPKNTQPNEALALANHIRKQRADLKHAIRHSPTLAVSVIENPPSFICGRRRNDPSRGGERYGMALSLILTAIPGIGAAKCFDLVRGTGVWPGHPIDKLSDRQRAIIAERVRDLTC